jgi:hypothetical protein
MLFSNEPCSLCQLDSVPTPEYPCPPLHFLPIQKGFMCLLCSSGPELSVHLWRSPRGRSRHFTQYHENCQLASSETDLPVSVQSFSQDDAFRNDFRVEVGLSSIDETADTPPISEVIESYMRNWVPITNATVTDTSSPSMKNIQPFAHTSGWAAHVSRFETPFLLDLVSIPPSSDPLHKLYKSTIMIFEYDQSCVDTVFEPLRQRLMESNERYGAAIRIWTVTYNSAGKLSPAPIKANGDLSFTPCKRRKVVLSMVRHGLVYSCLCYVVTSFGMPTPIPSLSLHSKSNGLGVHWHSATIPRKSNLLLWFSNCLAQSGLPILTTLSTWSTINSTTSLLGLRCLIT